MLGLGWRGGRAVSAGGGKGGSRGVREGERVLPSYLDVGGGTGFASHLASCPLEADRCFPIIYAGMSRY